MIFFSQNLINIKTSNLMSTAQDQGHREFKVVRYENDSYPSFKVMSMNLECAYKVYCNNHGTKSNFPNISDQEKLFYNEFTDKINEYIKTIPLNLTCYDHKELVTAFARNYKK